MLADVVQTLYTGLPDGLVYHYTGYEALLNIVKTGELWATDIHYFNDSSELRHAVDLFTRSLTDIARSAEFDKALVDQFRTWLGDRLADGHMLFVACLSEDGNLLSQWRGYTPHGKGVSLGFAPNYLAGRASAQGYKLGRCIYERQRQEAVARSTVLELLQSARADGPSPANKAHPSQSYYPALFEEEVSLLSIAALLKNPAFEAEREWRAVSPVLPSYVKNPALYRAGRTTLVPYRPFVLREDEDRSMRLAHVVMGPTPEINLAMSALSKFLSANQVSPSNGVRASLLPYRET